MLAIRMKGLGRRDGTSAWQREGQGPGIQANSVIHCGRFTVGTRLSLMMLACDSEGP